jgi:hypothetical protein
MIGDPPFSSSAFSDVSLARAAPMAAAGGGSIHAIAWASPAPHCAKLKAKGARSLVRISGGS